MRVLNFGSLNCDYVYTVPHMVGAGETLSSAQMEIFPGGKGLNQSIALARAGAPVYHAGIIGGDGEFLLDIARESGVDCTLVERLPGRTGHAIIQVDPTGQNCILLYGGTNRMVTEEYIGRALASFGTGDLLLLQNEINMPERVMRKAKDKGLTIALNPSPCDGALDHCDLGLVDWFILNELEGAALSGEQDLEKVPEALLNRYPRGKIVLTLGKEGAVYQDATHRFRQPAYPVKTVDTTGAGDTFTGFFLAAVLEGQEIPAALRLATKAAALAVSRKGAASSIPTRKEAEEVAEP